MELMLAVEKNFKAVFDNTEISTVFPLAELGIFIGFFRILTVEQIIQVVNERSLHSNGPSHGQRDSTTTQLLKNRHRPSYGSNSPVIKKSPEQDRGESDNNDGSDRLTIRSCPR